MEPGPEACARAERAVGERPGLTHAWSHQPSPVTHRCLLGTKDTDMAPDLKEKVRAM